MMEDAVDVIAPQQQRGGGAAIRRPRTRLLSPEEEQEQQQSSLRRRTVSNRNPCEISNDPTEKDVVSENGSSANLLAVCGTSHYLCHSSSESVSNPQAPLVIPFAYDVYYYNIPTENENDAEKENENEAATTTNSNSMRIMAYVGESILNQGAAAMQLMDCATNVGGTGARLGQGPSTRQRRRTTTQLEYGRRNTMEDTVVVVVQRASTFFTNAELDRFMGLHLDSSGQEIRPEGCMLDATAAAFDGTDCLAVQSALTVYLQLTDQEIANGVQVVPDEDRSAIQESVLSYLQAQMNDDVFVVPNAIEKVAFVDMNPPPTEANEGTSTPDVNNNGQNSNNNSDTQAATNDRNAAPTAQSTSTASTTTNNADQTTITALIAAGACLLALVSLVVFFLWRRNKHKKTNASAGTRQVKKSLAGELRGVTPPSTPERMTQSGSTPTAAAAAAGGVTANGDNKKEAQQQSSGGGARDALANRDSLALVPQKLDNVGLAARDSVDGDDGDAWYDQRTDSGSSAPMSVVGAEHLVDHIDLLNDDDGLSGFTGSTMSGMGDTLSCGAMNGGSALDDVGPPITELDTSSHPDFGTIESSGNEGDVEGVGDGDDDDEAFNDSTATYSDDGEELTAESASLALIAEVQRGESPSLQGGGPNGAASAMSTDNNDDMLQHDLDHDLDVLSATSYDTKKSAATRHLQMR